MTACEISQIGAKLDAAVINGRDWKTVKPIIRDFAVAFADLLGTEMLEGHHRLQPRQSVAVTAFNQNFVDEQARNFASTIQATLRPSP